MSAAIHFSVWRRGNRQGGAADRNGTAALHPSGPNGTAPEMHHSTLPGSSVDLSSIDGSARDEEDEEEEWIIDDDRASDDLAEGDEQLGVVLHAHRRKSLSAAASPSDGDLTEAAAAGGESASDGRRLRHRRRHGHRRHLLLVGGDHLENSQGWADSETAEAAEAAGSGEGGESDGGSDETKGKSSRGGSGSSPSSSSSGGQREELIRSVDEAIHHLDGLHNTLERMGGCRANLLLVHEVYSDERSWRAAYPGSVMQVIPQGGGEGGTDGDKGTGGP